MTPVPPVGWQPGDPLHLRTEGSVGRARPIFSLLSPPKDAFLNDAASWPTPGRFNDLDWLDSLGSTGGAR